VAFNEWKRNNCAAPCFDFAPTDNVAFPIGAFDEDVRPDSQNRFERSVLIEAANEIHHLQPAKKFRSIVFQNNRPVRAFHARDRPIGVNRNNQNVAQRASTAQKFDMARMQNIETAVRENDLFAGSLKNADFVCDSLNRCNHSP